MRKILLLLFIFASFFAGAQVGPTVTTYPGPWTPFNNYRFLNLNDSGTLRVQRQARFDDSVSIAGPMYVNSPPADGDSSARGVSSGWVKRNVTGSGGTPIDTTDKWVQSVTKKDDSTITVCKNGFCNDILIRGSGGGGSSTDNLNDVTARDSALNHTILALSTNSDTTAIRDSIDFKINQSWNTANLGIASKITHIFQDEKYGTNDPNGKPYERIYNRIWTNNYNGGGSSTHRRGLGQILMGYNMNGAQGRLNSGDAAFGMTLETDYLRSFEWYLQTETTTGLSYRPIFVRPYKDTTFCSITFRGNYMQAQLPDSSAEYLNVQNGQMTIFNIPNRTSPSTTNTIFNLTKGASTIALSNNGSDLLFTGASTAYRFDKSIYPTAATSYDLGAPSVFFKTAYAKALVNGYTITSDANYTQLATDHSINFKNITTTRTCTLIAGVAAGQKLELISGQASNSVTLAGTWPVKNIDGTTTTSLPAGKSYILVWDNTTFYWQVVAESPGGTGSVTSVTGTSPISSSGGTTPAISISDAAADGSTKGAASFTANDFNSSAGNISIDYANGQQATSSQNGFLSSTDWSTFNSKVDQSALDDTAAAIRASIPVPTDLKLQASQFKFVTPGDSLKVWGKPGRGAIYDPSDSSLTWTDNFLVDPSGNVTIGGTGASGLYIDATTSELGDHNGNNTGAMFRARGDAGTVGMGDLDGNNNGNKAELDDGAGTFTVTASAGTILSTPQTQGIDLTSGDFNITAPGSFSIDAGDVTNKIVLPNAVSYTTNSIRVVIRVKGGETVNIDSAGGLVLDKDGVNVSTIGGGPKDMIYVIETINNDWFIVNR